MKFNPDIVERVKDRSYGYCGLCRIPYGEDYEVDYLLRIDLGGPVCEDNMLVLCRLCYDRRPLPVVARFEILRRQVA